MDAQSHWNKIAPEYNAQIFDVFASDKKKVLQKFLKKYRNPKASAIDFGCGNGKAFPLLAPLFKEILAVDISEELLTQAKTTRYKKIQFQQADLSQTNVNLKQADFVFSCNVIMLAQLEKNVRMIKNIQQCLKPNGTALIIVPSTESILFSGWRLIDWYAREGTNAKEIDSSELSYFKGTKHELIQGIFYIDNVPTKHFSKEELQVLLSESGLSITAIEKIEYDWNTEFTEPPDWMKEPQPWDWLVECRKS